MQRVSKKQAKRIGELRESLGSQTFRSVMSTSESGRIVDPRRLARWEQGRGRLTEEESERLALVSRNAPNVKRLKEKNEDKTRWKVNHALRDWLAGGKEQGERVEKTPARQAQQRRATKALGYLGADTHSGKWYHKRKG